MARAKKRNVSPKQAMVQRKPPGPQPAERRPPMVPSTGVRQGGGGKAGPRPTGVGPKPAQARPPGPQPVRRKPAARDPLGIRREAHLSFLRANPNVARGTAAAAAGAAAFNAAYKPYAKANPNATPQAAAAALSATLGYTITRTRPNKPMGQKLPAKVTGGPFRMPKA